MTHYPNYIKSAQMWSESNFHGEQQKAAYDGYCAAAAAQIGIDADLLYDLFSEKKLRQLKKLLNDRNKITMSDIVESVHKDIRKTLIEGNNL